MRDQRRPARAALRRLPRARAPRGGRPAGRLAPAGAAVRREARHARRHDRRRDRRRRPDQGGAGRTAAVGRTDRPLRPAAARPPRNLRRQRAPGPRRQDPGRPVQHPAGRRRPDKGLPGAAAARRDDGVHRQSRGLHGAGEDHHAAQGPDRFGNPHPLPADPPRRDRHHAAGGVGRTRRGRGAGGQRSYPAVRPRDRRGDRVRGPVRPEDRPPVGREPAAPDHLPGECGLERRAAGARGRRAAGDGARHRRLRRPAVDHRQVRAGVRRRAPRRRSGGP